MLYKIIKLKELSIINLAGQYIENLIRISVVVYHKGKEV